MTTGRHVQIENPIVGEFGGVSWLCVGSVGERGTEGSERGVYFFDDTDKPLWFLPLDDADYDVHDGVNVYFAPNKKHVVIEGLGEAGSAVALYTFGDAKEKALFFAYAGFWVDANRFVFPLEEAGMGTMPDRDSHGGEIVVGWHSIAVVDTDGKPTRMMAATETKSCSILYDSVTGDVKADFEKRNLASARNR
ncbi:MAG: hypothetical protein LBS53_05170 [Synergistaceae bacterium]|jgi:hypothetical protein|nr:hypothetical protein [Synergistaceae bacterium]